MLFFGKAAVLLAQDADFLLQLAGLLALLGEFGLCQVDVVLGMAQALVLLGNTGLRGLGAFQRLFQLIGETGRPRFQSVQTLLGDLLRLFLFAAQAGQLFLSWASSTAGDPLAACACPHSASRFSYSSGVQGLPCWSR